MPRKKKTKKTEETAAFAASDFRVKAATVGSVDVSGVTGRTDVGKSKNYTAYLNTTVTETTAVVDAVLSSVSTSTGNALAITTTLPTTITASTVANTVPTEVGATITPATSGLASSGTLSLVTAVSTARPLSVSLDVSGGGYTFTDDGAGILSDGGSGTGTVDYSSGAWTLTASEILTTGTVISADYQVQYLYEETATPVVIRHTVNDDAPGNGTASAILSANALDANGIVTFTSTTFTLSTDDTPDDNPWNGKGALPGETAQETRSRFIDEGII